MKSHIPILAATMAATAVIAQVAKEKIDANDRAVVRASDVPWGALNPARGDKGPRAGALWNDRTAKTASGFLVRFADGFSSPPHTHNATYRAVVISGLIHNDDPDAAHMWMPAGSFWTQPRGENHVTAAKGSLNLALVEIDMGPYLVLPPTEAFDSGERPINVDASNIVWVKANDKDFSPNDPEIAYLWGSQEEGKSNGSFVKLHEGFVGTIYAHGSNFRAVVISGQLQYHGMANQSLEPGSYFSSNGEYLHNIASGETEVTIYVRTDGVFEVKAQGH